jgi:hypothetical protein
MLARVWEQAPEPKRLVWIEGADHFFQGTQESPGAKLNVMQAHLRTWIQETFALEAPAEPH